MKDYSVELKVCEGCGALFLRAAGRLEMAWKGSRATVGRMAANRNVTCGACAVKLSEFPPVRERRRRGFECRRVRTAVGAGGAR